MHAAAAHSFRHQHDAVFKHQRTTALPCECARREVPGTLDLEAVRHRSASEEACVAANQRQARAAVEVHSISAVAGE